MSAPIPSFFKIRLVLIIVGLLVVFFVLGLVKSVFANLSTAECSWWEKNIDSSFPIVDGRWFSVDFNYTTATCDRGSFAPADTNYNITLILYYYENGEKKSFISCGGGYGQSSPEMFPTVPVGSVTNCDDLRCLDEKAALEVECGGADKYAIDEETCEGHCLPDGNCIEEYNLKVEQCSETGIKFWNNDLCFGECNDDCIKDSGQDAYISWCLNTNCAGYDNVASLVYQESTDQYGCITVSKKECICNEDPPDGDCDSYRIQVDNECGGSAFVAAFYCMNDDWDNRYYECMYPEDPPTPPEATPDPVDPNNPPEAPDDPDPTEPDPTDSNALLAKIEDNTQSTVKNTKLVVDRLDTSNTYLENIADNQYATAANTGIIVDVLNEIKKEGVKLDDSNIVDGLGDLEASVDTLDAEVANISAGSYSSAPLGDAYTNETEGNIFSDRLDQFFQNVQQTGLFSLADTLTENIPTSGTSTMTIEAGQYGTHQFDFASWGNALLVLRYVFLTVFGWVAIRIVLLKR